MKKNLLAALCAGMLLAAVPTFGYTFDNATSIKNKAAAYGYLSEQWKTLSAQEKECVLACSVIASLWMGGSALIYSFVKLMEA